MRTPVTTIQSRYVVVATPNIDTDRIIPARFLTTITRDGLGKHAFHDWRHRADGTLDPAFPLNNESAVGARVLVAGRNFGCGSSREHAVWALLDAGFAAVISSDFADIFRSNAIGNGLVPVEVDEASLAALIDGAPQTPDAEVTIDVATQRVTLPGGATTGFPLAPFAKHCLMNGIDEMQFLQSAAPDIERYENTRLAREVGA